MKLSSSHLFALINKAVVTAAGLGTRLLSATKEMPKEMLPIFARNTNEELSLKPLLQTVFEQLCGEGINEFCFVVGKGKRSIVDHFTPDMEFVGKLHNKGKTESASDLRHFYGVVASAAISWVSQAEPLGFGDAVSKATSFVGRNHFMVHAGDTYIVSRRQSCLRRLFDADQGGNADATLVLLHVPPTKGYGFAVVEGRGPIYTVKRVVEKPARPPSNLAIMPIYAFSPAIFGALRSVTPGVGGEIQLTDGIQKLVEEGRTVQAIVLSSYDVRLDIGTPELYWEALRLSRKLFQRIG